MEYIEEFQPRLTYIAFGETDDFAHGGHYDAYLKSTRRTDQFIADLWSYIQADQGYQNKTTLIITTDHGRGTKPKDSWQHHGSKINGADQIWIAIIGPDTPASGEISISEQLYQNQVAATVANALGLEYSNVKPVGKVIESAFE
jgi:bisphosphoglycerate-independent phosphoglycerate mutase (AlkP superfamily)